MKKTGKKKNILSALGAMARFPNEHVAIMFIESLFFHDGLVCPRCGSRKITEDKSPKRRHWCKLCRRSFTVRTNTVFEHSKIPLHIWIQVLCAWHRCRNGIASTQLARDFGITQKSAWYLLHRIRSAVGFFKRILNGTVEMDEVYIGPKNRYRHARKRKSREAVNDEKAKIVGAVERYTGFLILEPMRTVNNRNITRFMKKNLAPDTYVSTDSSTIYNMIPFAYIHLPTVNHTKGQYAMWAGSTNKIEGLWPGLRVMFRTYRRISKSRYLQQYADEYAFRHNAGALTTPTMDFVTAALSTFRLTKTTYRRLVERRRRRKLKPPGGHGDGRHIRDGTAVSTQVVQA